MPYLAAFLFTLFIGLQALSQSAGLGIDLLVIGCLLAVTAILARQGIIVREARLLTSHLSQQIDRDPLTGLPNRRRAQEWIERELAQARASKQPLGLAVIDIDNFKSVNDTYGHSAGDHVLKAIAGILSRASRASDIALRYGGDEFLLVLPGLELEGAHLVGQRLLREIGRSRKATAPAFGVEISVSIGIAVCVDCLKNGKQLIAIADAAMYNAKESGKNQLVIVDADTKVLDFEDRLRSEAVEIADASQVMPTAG